MRAKLLVGELDLNGLIGAFELYSLRHRLVSRACAPRLFVFIHKNNQLTNGGASPTALLRLRGIHAIGFQRKDAKMQRRKGGVGLLSQANKSVFGEPRGVPVCLISLRLCAFASLR